MDYAAQGIRVNSVAPGSIMTELLERAMGGRDSDQMKQLNSQHPVGRLGTPEEIADAVVWMCSPGASFFTGHNLVVDGGLTV